MLFFAMRDADLTDATNYRDLAYRMRVLAQNMQDRGKQRELLEAASQYERLAAGLAGSVKKPNGSGV